MNLTELKEKLTKTGVREDFYSLSGGLPNDVFCINKTSRGWEVYYSERGLKSKIKTFSNEDEACNYFYEFIITDEVVINNLDIRNR